MHPGRQLAVLGLVFVVLYLLVFFAAGAKGSFKDRLEPKLGLDLVGGTQATYIASVRGGQVPSKESMERAREIIDERVNALGVSEAEVVIQGERNIVVSLAGEAKEELKDLAQPAQMLFRLLIGTTGDVAATALNPPAPSASASAGAKPPTGGKAPAANPGVAPSSGGQGGGEVVKAPSPSTPPSATPRPAAPPAAPLPRPEEAAKAGLPFARFGKLSGPEVNALSPQMQFNVPTISCAQLNARPNGAISDPNTQVATCYMGAKILLDKAPVVGDDISKASPQLDQQNGQWVVSLDFKSEGQAKWAALTRKAFEATSADQCFTAAQALYSSVEHCAVAVMLDKDVVSAPQIQGVLNSTSQITGQFTAVSAKKLADQLNFGALPVTFTGTAAQTITATLGLAQLEAGLLAAAIGMGLVAIYAFFYYRLLGSVIFLSLALSGLLTFGALAFLGRAVGFTLTLAGIAGFIVSLGVAADSFVIYFERLKDEIHEGRSPRSAVPRAWARARRTIISANTITILAAVVLYVVSVGAVQGFAFALGLSTVLDLLVVFLFRHPIMTMFANTKAFLSPRVSGLGRVLRTASTDAKEA